MRLRAFIAGAILVTMLGTAFRAGAAELYHSAGRSLAEQWCAECHQVIASQRASPNPAAPRFTDIAAGPGACELSLRLLLQSAAYDDAADPDDSRSTERACRLHHVA